MARAFILLWPTFADRFLEATANHLCHVSQPEGSRELPLHPLPVFPLRSSQQDVQVGVVVEPRSVQPQVLMDPLT